VISYVRDGGDWQVIASCAARFEDDCGEMAHGDQMPDGEWLLRRYGLLEK
jgi:hypothetical protein